MKKSQIIITLVLIASIIGTFAVYQLYVKVRYTELKDHKNEEAKLRAKIDLLSDKFHQTKPEIVLELWNSRKQPWFSSIKQRTEYFQLRDIEEIKVPDDVIPRIWYGEEYPKLEKKLEEMALASGTELNASTVKFGVKTPADYPPGTNPRRNEIQANIDLYLYGIEMTRLLIDHKAAQIDNIVMWNPRENPRGRTGTIKKSTTGYDFDITWANLTSLLESLRTNDRHYTVETIKIIQDKMRIKNDPLKVSMVVTQAWYSPTETTALTADGEPAATGQPGQPSQRASAMLNDLFGGGGIGSGKVVTAPTAESESFFKRLMFKLSPF
jgi:hypothetical protein